MRVSLSMVYLCMALAGSVQSMRYGCVSVRRQLYKLLHDCNSSTSATANSHEGSNLVVVSAIYCNFKVKCFCHAILILKRALATPRGSKTLILISFA